MGELGNVGHLGANHVADQHVDILLQVVHLAGRRDLVLVLRSILLSGLQRGALFGSSRLFRHWFGLLVMSWWLSCHIGDMCHYLQCADLLRHGARHVGEHECRRAPESQLCHH